MIYNNCRQYFPPIFWKLPIFISIDEAALYKMPKKTKIVCNMF